MVVKKPFPDAVAVTRLIVLADHRPALVNRAQHGVPVQGCAPAVVQTRHDPATPPVPFRQFVRNVIVTHQHHLQAAAACLAGGARYDGTITRIDGIIFCIHCATFSHLIKP